MQLSGKRFKLCTYLHVHKMVTRVTVVDVCTDLFRVCADGWLCLIALQLFHHMFPKEVSNLGETQSQIRKAISVNLHVMFSKYCQHMQKYTVTAGNVT